MQVKLTASSSSRVFGSYGNSAIFKKNYYGTNEPHLLAQFAYYTSLIGTHPTDYNNAPIQHLIKTSLRMDLEIEYTITLNSCTTIHMNRRYILHSVCKCTYESCTIGC